ncbi:MAG: hypothetical protein IKS52_12595, partial [Clostridia bacterium]|nr:hypothetical protein [Clostridia bacterium]
KWDPTANEGQGAFVDTYERKWDPTANEGQGAYVNELVMVLAGESFTVKMSNAKVYDETEARLLNSITLDALKPEGVTEWNWEDYVKANSDNSYNYTVQLRAEYKDPEEKTPTHIWWFPNYPNFEGDETKNKAVHKDDPIDINASITIQDPPTRTGYEFLGWAKVPQGTSRSYKDANGDPIGNILSNDQLGITGIDSDNFDDSQLFLIYDKDAQDYKAYVNGVKKTVDCIAADENPTFDDLYAVWKRTIFELEVTKTVDGPMADSSREFSFTLSGLKANDVYLVNNMDYTATIDEPITFTLQDTGSITFGLLSGTYTVTEVAQGDCVTYMKLNNGSEEQVNSKQITLDSDDATLAVRNNMPAISPTGVSFAFAPYALMLACGVLLLLVRRKRRA